MPPCRSKPVLPVYLPAIALPLLSAADSDSLILNFERHPDSKSKTYPEYFTIDISNPVPGDYSMVIGITDHASAEVHLKF